MPLFRFHRGGLSEALKTTVIVKNKMELLEVLNKDENISYHYKITDIKIEPYPDEKSNFDERIGWYTHIVMINDKRIGHPYPAGVLSENIETS